MALDASGEHFTSEFNPQTGQQTFRAHSLPAIDPQWSILVGEVLYQLRSSLDHLAWQLVLLDGGTPNQQTQFPILTKPPTGKKRQPLPVQLKPPVENPEILAALDKCQPYKGRDGKILPYQDSPLWQLHRLNIIDKHRLLLVVVCVLDFDSMYWAGHPDMPVPGDIKVATGPLQEDSPVAWFTWPQKMPPVDFNPHLALEVSLNETIPVGTRPTPTPLVDILTIYCQWVRSEIVELEFRPLFP